MGGDCLGCRRGGPRLWEGDTLVENGDGGENGWEDCGAGSLGLGWVGCSGLEAG